MTTKCEESKNSWLTAKLLKVSPPYGPNAKLPVKCGNEVLPNMISNRLCVPSDCIPFWPVSQNLLTIYGALILHRLPETESAVERHLSWLKLDGRITGGKSS